MADQYIAVGTGVQIEAKESDFRICGYSDIRPPRSVGLFIGILVGGAGFVGQDAIDVARPVQDADDFDAITGGPVENQVLLKAFDTPDT